MNGIVKSTNRKRFCDDPVGSVPSNRPSTFQYLGFRQFALADRCREELPVIRPIGAYVRELPKLKSNAAMARDTSIVFSKT